MTEQPPSSPPRKKMRLASDHNTSPTAAPSNTIIPRMNTKEEDVGISAFVNPHVPGFAAIFKKRYTDFLVNELLPTGEVVHLLSTRAPTFQKQEPEQPKTDPEPHSASDVKESEPAQQTQPAPATKAEVSVRPVEDDHAANGEKGAINGSAEITEQNAAAEDSAVSAWQQYSEASGNLKLGPEDEATLTALTDADTTQNLVAFFNKVLASPNRRPREHGSVACGVIQDKEKRTNLHQAIRATFRSRLESYTEEDGSFIVQAAADQRVERGGQGNRGRGGGGARGRGGRGGSNPQRINRPSFQELGGDYLHFTLYKENRDTMEAISYMARELHTKPQQFQFAGTKDRRGVTVQRVSVFRIFAERLAAIGRKGRGWRIGDFEYKPYALSLGDLTGNEFTITLRECQNTENVAPAIEGLKRGFLNYYGMQRFGTFATRTDTIGVYLLKGDFESAVNAILKYPQHCLDAAKDSENPEGAQVGSDDRDRALAIHHFEQGQFRAALSTLPRKFSAENQLIRHLSGKNGGDFFGAIQSIQRNLRLMYVHAYQSVIWNLAATHRWTSHGDKVLEGDLVLVNDFKDKAATTSAPAEEVDADGEVIINPSGEDRAVSDDDRFERARALTAEEAASGKYTIFDIVLPTPGYDILYPSYMVKFYEETMAKDEYGNLDPHDMRRKWREISLSGSYRKMLSRVENVEFHIKEYKEENEQFVETDADKLSKTNARVRPNRDTESQEAKASDEMQTDEAEKPTKTAVVLKFQLGSSQYATMALRELMKGGLETYKMDFSGGR